MVTKLFNIWEKNVIAGWGEIVVGLVGTCLHVKE
jgi:hypothetical protein